jgi:hypothetical protein
MTLDWAHFTPWASLSGGLLIGLAAGILILGAGRIMGAAGILGGVVDPRPGDVGWRLWRSPACCWRPAFSCCFRWPGRR